MTFLQRILQKTENGKMPGMFLDWLLIAGDLEKLLLGVRGVMNCRCCEQSAREEYEKPS